MNLRFAIDALVSLFLPSECHLCGRPLPATRRFLCTDCLVSLPLSGYDPATSPLTDRLLSLGASSGKGTAWLRYRPGNAAATLIHDFKYRGFSFLARSLGREAATSLELTGFFDDIDLIVPVPLHFTRRIKRGYNQAEMIACGVADVTGIPVSDALRAVRPHGSQTKLSGTSRAANVKGVFRVSRPEILTGKRILLVDDVFTTGATLLEAASEIASASPGARIGALALASAFHNK